MASILVCNCFLNKMVLASSLPVLGTWCGHCAWSDKMFGSQANLIRMSLNEICETWMDSKSIQKVIFIVNPNIPIPVSIVSALKLQCRVFTKRFNFVRNICNLIYAVVVQWPQRLMKYILFIWGCSSNLIGPFGFF